jgi:MFS family permease
MKVEVRLSKFSKNALLYLAAIFFFYISSGAFGMLQGLYIKELKISESFLGIILSIRIFATAVFSIPCAMVINKFGKRFGIICAMLFVPITIIMQGYFMNKWNILLFAALQGGFTSFLTVSEGPFFMENSEKNVRIKLFSYSFADNVFSSMIGYFVFGNVTGNLNNILGNVEALRVSIIISGVLGFLSCIFTFSIKEKQTNVVAGKRNITKDIMAILKQPYPLKYVFYNSMIGFGAGLVVPYFNVYLKYKVNATTSQIGLIMALAQGAMGIGGLITPLMAKKYGRIKTIIICQIVSIPFLMLIAIPPSILIVSIALFVRNALMNMTGPITGNLSMEMVKDYERSIFASINNIAGNLSRALSAVVAGFIMNNFANGYELPYFVTAIMYAAATVYFYYSFRVFDKIPKYNNVKNVLSDGDI